MSKIVTFTDKFGDRTLHEHALRSPSFTGDTTPPQEGVVLDVSTDAFVNGSRWVALCPTGGCNGCEYVNVDDPRFFCCNCRNAAYGYVPIRVVLPDERTRAQVEAYLSARPAWQTRNWISSESVASVFGETPQTVRDLRDENRSHGVRLEVS